jgi:nitrile hydratase
MSERGVHDVGGVATAEPIDRSEHALEDWELLVDALMQTLTRRGVMTVDELRRGIESMPRDRYESARYYERWLWSIELLMTEKGIVTTEEIEARL